MRKYAIVTKDDDLSRKTGKYIREALFNRGMTYVESNPDIVCIIGGDGTFLTAIHKYIKRLNETVFVGINTGTLGFFTDYTSEQVEDFINDVVTVEPVIEEKSLLKATLIGEKTSVLEAVNEIRIESVLSTLTTDIYINDKHLETCRGTGICVSTQMGSTAYNRSLNGAVVESGLDIMQLTEITGIHHSEFRSLQAPLILSGKNRIKIIGNWQASGVLCFDRYALKMKDIKEIHCTLSDRKYRLAHFRPNEYIERLYHLF